MAKLVRATVLAGLVALSVSATPALPDENEYKGDLQELLELVENTSFVWFSELNERAVEELSNIFATKAEPILDVIAIYPNLGGFAVRIKPEEARKRLEYFQTLSEIQLPKNTRIESDTLVYSFQASCDNPTSLPTNQEVPTGVRRVGEPPAGFHTSAHVWIIDGGVADDFDGSELNVDRSRSRECHPGGICNTGNHARVDSTGHGTMIAGIIAAIDDTDGYVGIAPGAMVIPIKVFYGSSSSPTDLAAIYSALDYLHDPSIGAESGDVLNISWGFMWKPISYQQLEQALRNLANQGVKIAIAAGNYEPPMQGGGFVQTVSPARIGGYQPSSGNGTIVTVSAVESDDITGPWIDTFWPYSFFGNGKIVSGVQKGPPNFAEPGVDVSSLWPGPGLRGNTCTGTSFAAPHMAGMFLRGMPVMDGTARKDPSAVIPATSVSGATPPQCWLADPQPPQLPTYAGCYDASRQDPIGVLP